MKDRLGIVIGTLVFLALCAGLFYVIEYKEDYYYTKVDNNNIKEVKGGDLKYEYELTSYDDRGWMKKISFKVNRKLEDGSYLKLKVLFTGVNSFKEVEYDDLPEKVQEKIVEK